LIDFSKYSYTARRAITRQDDEERIRKILDEIPVKLTALNQRRHKQEVKKSRIIDLYTDDRLTRSDMERKLTSVERELRKIDESQNELIKEQTSLQVSLRNYQEGKIASTVDSTLESFDNASRREIYELVHSEVEEVEVYRLGKFKYFLFKMKAGYTNLARMSGRARCFKCEIEVKGKWVEYKAR
jgi:DNA repair exonuclease SbcCD ATPase subunit